MIKVNTKKEKKPSPGRTKVELIIEWVGWLKWNSIPTKVRTTLYGISREFHSNSLPHINPLHSLFYFIFTQSPKNLFAKLFFFLFEERGRYNNIATPRDALQKGGAYASKLEGVGFEFEVLY